MISTILNWLGKRRRTEQGAAVVSPVFWIDADVWADWTKYPTRRLESPIVEPQIREVTDDDRARAPRRRLLSEDVAPVVAAADDHAQLLDSTPPASGGVYRPYWPVCCKQLATLVQCEGGGRSLERIEREAGTLDLAFIEAQVREASDAPAALAHRRERGYSEELAQVRHGQHGWDGFTVFECRVCGRTYVGTCET